MREIVARPVAMQLTYNLKVGGSNPTIGTEREEIWRNKEINRQNLSRQKAFRERATGEDKRR